MLLKKKKKQEKKKRNLEELCLWAFSTLTFVIWLLKAVGAEFNNTTGLFTERGNLRAEGGGMIEVCKARLTLKGQMQGQTAMSSSTRTREHVIYIARATKKKVILHTVELLGLKETLEIL